MSIIIKVKELAKQQGHTFASLERELGFGSGSIRKWDTNSPSADKLVKVANFLNTSTDYLLGIEKNSDRSAEFVELFSKLSEEQQKLVVSQMKGILSYSSDENNKTQKITISSDKSLIVKAAANSGKNYSSGDEEETEPIGI